jgi:hypothetical protein
MRNLSPAQPLAMELAIAHKKSPGNHRGFFRNLIEVITSSLPDVDR